jgi:hypothetical protein
VRQRRLARAGRAGQRHQLPGPTGKITLNLYDPTDETCSGTPALTQTVDVNGNGTYSTTNTSFVATTEGTWRWASSYIGDANNEPTSSSCGTEQFAIINH